MRAFVLASIVFAGLLGCSATNKVNFGTGAGESSSSGAGAGSSSGTHSSGTMSTTSTSSGAGASGAGGGGQGGGIGLGGGITTGTGGSNNCSAAAELVYVWGTDNNIYSFDPPNKVFTKIATPDCPATGTPNSMAIDRNLIAWLNYLDGHLYTFDLNKKSGCQLAVTLPTGFTQVGMGFSADMVGGTAETLYVDGIGGTGLAKIVNNNLVPIGTFANDQYLMGQSCELTGTGDAKLYGYFTTSPNVRVAEIDKATANILTDHELMGFPPPSDWAFSFWGGDFYLYAVPVPVNNSANSSVVHYNPKTQALDLSYVPDVGFTIIGAGVSTCAPIGPPK
jgi:hypothetical protein